MCEHCRRLIRPNAAVGSCTQQTQKGRQKQENEINSIRNTVLRRYFYAFFTFIHRSGARCHRLKHSYSESMINAGPRSFPLRVISLWNRLLQSRSLHFYLLVCVHFNASYDEYWLLFRRFFSWQNLVGLLSFNITEYSSYCYCTCSILSLFLFHIPTVHFSSGLTSLSAILFLQNLFFWHFYVFRAVFGTVLVSLSYLVCCHSVFFCFLDK